MKTLYDLCLHDVMAWEMLHVLLNLYEIMATSLLSF